MCNSTFKVICVSLKYPHFIQERLFCKGVISKWHSCMHLIVDFFINFKKASVDIPEKKKDLASL